MTTQASPFGARLRQWRQHRGLSQLSLAGQVGSTGRHISFLETGRSRPSRQMVLRLADTLGMGLRETNELLHAAGLPAAYPTPGWTAPIWPRTGRWWSGCWPRTSRIRGWCSTGTSRCSPPTRPCRALFGRTWWAGTSSGTRWPTRPPPRRIVNWPEVAWAGLDRLRRQHRLTPFDAELGRLVALAETALAGVPRPRAGRAGVAGVPVVPDR